MTKRPAVASTLGAADPAHPITAAVAQGYPLRAQVFIGEDVKTGLVVAWVPGIVDHNGAELALPVVVLTDEPAIGAFVHRGPIAFHGPTS